MEESLRKCPYPHIGYQKEFKDGMSSDAIDGEPSHLEVNHTFSPSMPTIDVLSEPIFQPILNPDKSSYTLSPESHDDPRNSPRHPNHRNHEDYKDDQEEQRQWQECLDYTKNTYAIVKEWMHKDKALWLGSKLGLDPNGELKPISSINMTYPSLEEALDEINPRDTNPWEILDNKTSNDCHRHGMMIPPIDIHKETPLELEKEDDIDEHGSYFINTSLNPYSHENFLESIGLSNFAIHEIFNPLMLSVPKNFKKVVVDIYVYHKYHRSHCVNLEISTQILVLEGKPLHQLEAQFKVSQG
jgi:hypothetical protein